MSLHILLLRYLHKRPKSNMTPTSPWRCNCKKKSKLDKLTQIRAVALRTTEDPVQVKILDRQTYPSESVPPTPALSSPRAINAVIPASTDPLIMTVLRMMMHHLFTKKPSKVRLTYRRQGIRNIQNRIRRHAPRRLQSRLLCQDRAPLFDR